MDITIQPGKLSGTIAAIPSKSQAHRLLICAAFADKPTRLLCPETNRDIQATADCLNALGANINRTDIGYTIEPVRKVPDGAVLNCCESGSTLRFMLPIVGALGVDACFLLEGRLPQRPLSPLWEEMERMGCTLERPTANTISCHGKLRQGLYTIDGGVSSQFVTGLLYAMSLMKWDVGSALDLTGKVESQPYIDMTLSALTQFGVHIPHTSTHYSVLPGEFRSPGTIQVEGDWSNAAFWLAAQALGSQVELVGLDQNSAQGDRACAWLLPGLKNAHITINASHIPDLVPILSVSAAASNGAVFTHIQRLRIKESDRVASTIAMIEALGGRAEATDSTLTVCGTGLTGGTVDAVNDHRIAMSAAIAATVCAQPITILGAECVQKSYPAFWDDYKKLGGRI